MKEFGMGERRKRREQGKMERIIIKVNCSSAFYKAVVNNKILKAVESPFQ